MGGLRRCLRLAFRPGDDLVGTTRTLADELPAGGDDKTLAADLPLQPSTGDDFDTGAGDPSFDFPGDHERFGLDAAFEPTLGADGYIAPAMDAAFDPAVDVQFALQAQFAVDSGALSDNCGATPLCSWRFTALAKESHWTPPSRVNSAS